MTCVEKLLPSIDGGRMLDAGCGNGRSTRLLVDGLRSVRTVVGIDPDKNSLDEARRQTDDRRISYRQLSVMDLAADPERFETTAISYALHHVVDPASVLERLVSVLVPRGVLIINEAFSDALSPAQANARDLHHFKAAIDRMRGTEHRDTYTADEIRTLVGATGVTVVDECIEEPEDDDPPAERAREAFKFLENYIPFIEDRPEYQEMIALKRELVARITEIGIDSPPHLFIVARKSETSN